MMDKITIEGGAWLTLGLYLLLLPVSWVAGMLIAAVVHEMGHCIALYLLDEPVLHIRIGSFGARIRTLPMDHRKELICALAGPLFGLTVCLFWRWMPKAAFFALCQNLFNLLPIWPMDGGRVLQSVRKWKSG